MNFLQKILNWIKRHKVITFLVIFVVVGLVLFLVLYNRKTKTPPPPTEVKITTLNSPIVSPSSGRVALAGTTNAISLFFDEIVDLNTVVVESTPNMVFTKKVLNDVPNRVILQPQSPWEEGITYKIKILKGVKTVAYPDEYDITQPSQGYASVLQNDVNIEYTILPIPSFEAPY